MDEIVFREELHWYPIADPTEDPDIIPFAFFFCV